MLKTWRWTLWLDVLIREGLTTPLLWLTSPPLMTSTTLPPYSISGGSGTSAFYTSKLSIIFHSSFMILLFWFINHLINYHLINYYLINYHLINHYFINHHLTHHYRIHHHLIVVNSSSSWKQWDYHLLIDDILFFLISSMRSTNTPEQKNNNQAKDVSLLNSSSNNSPPDNLPSDNSSSDNSSSDNSSSSNDILLAMKKSSDKKRSREFMHRRKFLFKRSSQLKFSEFKRVKEIFNIDFIDTFEQTIDISEQTTNIAV